MFKNNQDELLSVNTSYPIILSDFSPRLYLRSIPPMSETQWEDAFEQYKQFFEYQEINSGMSFAEFQVIFLGIPSPDA